MDELTHRYIRGDGNALAELFIEKQPSLRLLAYQYCRDAETAKDVVQEVFEKLAGLEPELRASWFGTDSGNLSAWLHVAVRNKAMDVVKVRTKRGKILESVRYASTGTLENKASERICRDDIQKILGNLQPRQREVLTMHIDGYRNEEIADSLGITYNTVKNNIYEARQRIRRLWRTFME